MNQKVLLTVSLVCGCLCGPASTAESITIGFEPLVQQTTGGPVKIDLVASDLGAFMHPSLGAFDLTIDFDPAIISLTDTTFGSFLGNPGAGEAFVQATIVGSHSVNLVGLSFLMPTELNARQPDAFALATLVFSPIALGESALLLEVNALSNELGESFSFVKTEDGKIQSIPEPPVLFVVGGGLIWMAARLRTRLFSRHKGAAIDD
jgi:hypothetical protein